MRTRSECWKKFVRTVFVNCARLLPCRKWNWRSEKVNQNRVSRIEHGDIERARLDTLRKYVEAVGGELRVEVIIGD